MTAIKKALSEDVPANVCDIERGNFAPAQTALNAQTIKTKLVIVTYNIRYAVGSRLISGGLLRRIGLSNHKRRPALVSQHLDQSARALSDNSRLPPADVIALQEADKQTLRAGRHHVARELARRLAMDYAHAPLQAPRDVASKSKQWYLDFEERIEPLDGGDTGLAVLSRFQMTSAARIELPWRDCPWRPRIALATTIATGSQSVHLFNTHIDPHACADEQLAQHLAVIERARACSGPTILLGDFNTLTLSKRNAMLELYQAHGYQTPLPSGTKTWRAGFLRLQTDWIFVRGARVHRCGVARRLNVSDHWPVWIEIGTPRTLTSA